MSVKCLAQEHNAVPQPGLEPGPPDPESSVLTIRPPRLPNPIDENVEKGGQLTIFCKIKLVHNEKEHSYWSRVCGSTDRAQ